MKDDNDNKNVDIEKLPNQEITVIISINGETRNTKCNLKGPIRDIWKGMHMKIPLSNLIYNGKIINENSILEDIINEDDKKTKIVRFLVREINKTSKKIKSEDIICPKCQESIFMTIKDYRINLFDCKNKHKINNLLLNEFEKTQIIDLSKIICNICKVETKDNTYNNLFYRCLECGINICPLCKSKHEKSHKIINYDEKDYICIEHNERYKYYCPQCKVNICQNCESKHKNHNISK